ncbi:MAG: TIGR00341 family protein [Bacteroidaceae bacterium]|nr:TIGR00341 family protein [Bacteroidaceae bacterium]
MEEKSTNIWSMIRKRFIVSDDRLSEEETVSEIAKGAIFNGSNVWLLIFAIFIASLGLNVNSTAVIIGAMLISPLMGPIIAMGLAVGINDLTLLKRAFKNYLIATIISVATAYIYFLISPVVGTQSELLARTSPTLYDVLIAFFGGAAGILGNSTRGNSNVIPGVAIATALMPPLCTAGFGLAIGNMSYFFGAFYLYFINSVFIGVATFTGVHLMHFHDKKFEDQKKLLQVRRYIYALCLLTMVPAAIMTYQIIRKNITEKRVDKFINSELNFNGAEIISHSIDNEKKTLNIIFVGKLIADSDLKKADEQLANYDLQNFKLNIIQGSQTDSLLLLNKMESQNEKASKEKLIEQSAQIYELENKLNEYTKISSTSRSMTGEMKALFPEVKSYSLSSATECLTDTTLEKNYILGVVDLDDETKLSDLEKNKLHEWMKERLQVDSLRIIFN